jgi:anti-sigma factor RsiW
LQSEEHAGLLLDYCARRLDGARAAALEAHMEQCPACREFRDGQKLVWETLDAWDVSENNWGFERRLRERLEEEGEPQWVYEMKGWARGISWKPAIPLAAALAVWMVFYGG